MPITLKIHYFRALFLRKLRNGSVQQGIYYHATFKVHALAVNAWTGSAKSQILLVLEDKLRSKSAILLRDVVNSERRMEFVAQNIYETL